MKNIIKTILICSLFSLMSCEKDLYEEQIKSTGNGKKFITFNEFKSNSKAFKLYEDLSQVTNQVTQNENELTQERLIYNEILGFYINTDKILYTVKDDLQTYTFEVYRNTDDLNKVENLVLCFKSSGEFESYLTEYKFTELDKELIKSGLNVPNYFSKISISSLKGTKLVEEGDYSGAIYHDEFGNCYNIDEIIDIGEGEVIITYVQVDCPNVLAGTDGNESGGDGSYTGPSPSPSYIFYNGIQIPIGSGDWYPGAGEPGTGIDDDNPVNNENNPENPLINTSPVLADGLDSGKAYETAKKIRAIITLSNAQFNYLLHNYTNSLNILDFLNENDDDESKAFAIEIIITSILLEINAGVVWNDYDRFVGQMSISEKAIFDNLLPNRKLWYMCSAKKASEKAAILFPESLHNGKGDAFRHALWNGLCALTLAGNLGEQLTTAHEDKPAPAGDLFNYKEVEMDLYNNNKGRQIALVSNLTNITDNVLQDLNNGYLRYLNNLDTENDHRATYYSVLIPSDQ